MSLTRSIVFISASFLLHDLHLNVLIHCEHDSFRIFSLSVKTLDY